MLLLRQSIAKRKAGKEQNYAGRYLGYGLGQVPSGTEIIKAMDSPRSEYVNLPALSDDDLWDAFAWADEHNDRETAVRCSREITRRCNLPAPVVTDMPPWLQWLTAKLGLWKQGSTVGEGRGRSGKLSRSVDHPSGR
jgi:hypothetical protein